MHITRLFIFSSLAGFGLMACSSSTATPAGAMGTGGAASTTSGGAAMGATGNTGAVSPTGGTTAGGGTTATGGTVNTGGSGNTTSTGDLPTNTTIQGCADSSIIPLATLDAFEVCNQCANAHCVPNAAVPAEQLDLLAPCDDTSMCVPDAYAYYTGKFKAQNCTSLGGAEGRCISVCVPQVAQQADQLPQDNCADGELCAPCYNPIDGVDTGACNQGCTDPATEAPYVFASCGDNLGVCVPSDLVPANLKDAVPVDTCDAAAGELCAPIEKARDINYKFVSCPPSAAGLPPDPSQQGACVPLYIAANNASGGLLTDSGQCADDPGDPGAGYICAPCVNPLDGTSTGACE